MEEICNICNQLFDSKAEYWVHYYQSHDEGVLCLLCKKYYQDIDNHYKLIHKEIENKLVFNKDDKYTCQLCDINYESKNRLIKHIRRMHVKNNIDCKYCKKQITVLGIENHEKICKYIPNTKKCIICAELFNNEVEYLKHYTTVE